MPRGRVATKNWGSIVRRVGCVNRRGAYGFTRRRFLISRSREVWLFQFLDTGADLGRDLASGVMHSFWGVLFGEALTRSVLPAGGGVKKNSQCQPH